MHVATQISLGKKLKENAEDFNNKYFKKLCSQILLIDVLFLHKYHSGHAIKMCLNKRCNPHLGLPFDIFIVDITYRVHMYNFIMFHRSCLSPILLKIYSLLFKIKVTF